MAKKIATHIVEEKEDNEAGFLAKKNVVGVGIGYKHVGGRKTKDVAVVAMVEKKLPASALSWGDVLPRSLGDVPIDVQEIGRVDALSNTGRVRPVYAGFSVGHYNITAGTIGVWATELLTGKKVLLSNNHVLADSNEGKIGDPILQPGPADGGGHLDQIATLYRKIPIDFGEEPGNGDCPFAETYARFGNWIAGLLGRTHRVVTKKVRPQATNLVDAALALPLDGIEIVDEIIDIGEVSGITDYFLGQKVQKSGRTTGLTTCEITHVMATIDVNYGDGKVARFTDQLVTGFMSQGGDSGSLLVDRDTRALHPRAVGLLFAGSNTTTIHNPIKHVVDALEIEIR